MTEMAISPPRRRTIEDTVRNFVEKTQAPLAV